MAKTRKNTLIFALLGSSASLCVAAPAAAQEAAPQHSVVSDSDIIVTARKRDETLLDVPVAVSALSAADMNRYQANDLTKIGQMVPQVIIAKTGGGGAGASFAIRGVGSSALDSGIEQTVSVNIDGLQVSRGRLATQGFFDLQQVEVLKGPQALFFGKNSPGGVISLRTAGATRSFQGYARAGYEFNADERYIEGAVSGPISDTLGFRIAGRANKMDGYLTNVAGPLVLPSDPSFIRPGAGARNSPSNREFLGRLTLEWNPTDAFKAVLKVFGSDLKNNGETANNEVKCNGGPPQTLDIVTGTYVSDTYGDCTLNGVRSSTALPAGRAVNYPGAKDGRPYTDYKSILTSLSMDYKLDWATITSVTGYYSYDNGSFDNFDFSAVGAVWGFNQDQSSAFSQELRIATDFTGPFNVVVGGYFESAKRDTLGNGAIASVGLDPVTGRYDNWSLISENHGKTYSLFGQAIWNILPNLELAGGVRWTRETKRVLVAN
ncbi:MAG: TonB-dependent receptor plug domain-containing protein, partial [Phenylobacterium sp.]|nr:TonB-dependent receptor plug domain-containing protein [Phenylobacterium sp.]